MDTRINDNGRVLVSMAAYQADSGALRSHLHHWGLDFSLSCDTSGEQPCNGVVSNYTKGKTIGLPEKIREHFQFPNPFGGAYQRGDLFDAAGALEILRGTQ